MDNKANKDKYRKSMSEKLKKMHALKESIDINDKKIAKYKKKIKKAKKHNDLLRQMIFDSTPDEVSQVLIRPMIDGVAEVLTAMFQSDPFKGTYKINTDNLVSFVVTWENKDSEYSIQMYKRSNEDPEFYYFDSLADIRYEKGQHGYSQTLNCTHVRLPDSYQEIAELVTERELPIMI